MKYALPNKAEQGNDFICSIKQIESFNFKPSFGEADLSTILGIDNNSFYLIGVSSMKESMVYVDLCKKTPNGRISCSQYWSSRIQFDVVSKFEVNKITAETTPNGDRYATWTYKLSTLTCILDLNKKQLSMEVTGNLKGIGYSSAAIAEEYIVMVSKVGRRF